ncbi:DUF6318 family protein [Kribbella sp. NPDC020789]
MTTRNKPALLTACATTLALALTACGPGSPQAGRPNTAPPSTTATQPSVSSPGGPSSSTPTTVLTRPEAATGLTLASAEAFIGYYVSLLNHAYKTGEIQFFSNESDKGCVGCKSIADFVKVSNGANGGLTGDYLDQLVSVDNVARGAEPGRVGGSAKIRTGAYKERTSPTAKPVDRPVSNSEMTFSLIARDNNWVMFEMDISE